MIEEKLNHTPKEIVEKDFKVDTKGYRTLEVDQYLDEIIEDEEKMLEIIKKLEKEKEDMLSEMMKLKQELRNVRMDVDIASNNKKEVTNMDILRRISNLEKEIYEKNEKE